MIYKIVVTPDAIENIENAVNYYKNIASPKVAKLFIDDYRKTFKDIQKTKYFQFFFEDFRCKPMKKFPYVVFYTIDEDIKVIIIKAVFHTSKNPNKYTK